MTAQTPNPRDSDNIVPLDLEAAIEAIQTSRRRHVLVILDEVKSPYSAGDLAEAIAAIELNKEISELDAQERKRVYITLIQLHLPKLDEFGAIAYDERSKQVYETEATRALTNTIRYLESVCEPSGD